MLNDHYLSELRELARAQDCPGNVGLCAVCQQRLLEAVRGYLGIDAILEKERESQ